MSEVFCSYKDQTKALDVARKLNLNAVDGEPKWVVEPSKETVNKWAVIRFEGEENES